ncbi:MAG: hypothetical protein LBR85_00400 [Oscillospiraceae bacterium]|jgi:hypothetical protein|nr:hypothetical protein [Oscillospiraceae bacterium]
MTEHIGRLGKLRRMSPPAPVRYGMLFIGIFIATQVLWDILGIIESIFRLNFFPVTGYIVDGTFLSVPLVLGVLVFRLLNKERCRINPIKLTAVALAGEVLFQLCRRLVFYFEIPFAAALGLEVFAVLLGAFLFGFAIFFAGRGKLSGKLITLKSVLAVVCIALLAGFGAYFYSASLSLKYHEIRLYQYQNLFLAFKEFILVLAMYFVVLWADKRFKGIPLKTAQQPSPPTDEAE